MEVNIYYNGRQTAIDFRSIRWTTRDGSHVALVAMNDQHLRNTLRMLYRSYDQLLTREQRHAQHTWTQIFEHVARGRNMLCTPICDSRCEPEGERRTTGPVTSTISGQWLVDALNWTLANPRPFTDKDGEL